MSYAAALRNYHPVVDFHRVQERYEKGVHADKSKSRVSKNMSMLNSLEEESPSKEADGGQNLERHQSFDREVTREKLRINKLNNGFSSQKELVTASPPFNADLHKKKFSVNAVGQDRLNGKHQSVFLPPINKESLQNLRSKADLIKVNLKTGAPRSGFHARRDSETERKSLLQRIGSEGGSTAGHKKISLKSHRNTSNRYKEEA